MATPVWPATLPHECEASAFTRRPYRGMVATEMEGGNVRLRRRPGDRVETVGWARRFTPTQHAIWAGFLKDTIADGTRQFVMPIWSGEDYQNRLVQIVDGGGGVSEAVTARGLYTRVGFSLLVFPPEMTPVE